MGKNALALDSNFPGFLLCTNEPTTGSVHRHRNHRQRFKSGEANEVSYLSCPSHRTPACWQRLVLTLTLLTVREELFQSVSFEDFPPCRINTAAKVSPKLQVCRLHAVYICLYICTCLINIHTTDIYVDRSINYHYVWKKPSFTALAWKPSFGNGCHSSRFPVTMETQYLDKEKRWLLCCLSVFKVGWARVSDISKQMSSWEELIK